MDQLRATAQLPLKRMYQLFPSKDELVLAFLRRRHTTMMSAIAARIDAVARQQDRVLAIFDWLHDWFREPGYRGCAWLNAYGELGPTNAAVAAETRRHKRAFRKLITSTTTDAGYSAETAEAVYLLTEGAIAAAAVQRTATPATDARRTAEVLLRGDKARARRKTS